jgi:hypothetical protein
VALKRAVIFLVDVVFIEYVDCNAEYYENEQGRLKENISREERYNGRTGKKSTHGG